MLKKCLKYDLQFIWRIWWILAVSVIGIGTFASLCLRFGIEGMFRNPEDVSILATIGFILMIFLAVMAVFALAAFMTVTPILVYYRFYKHFYSDEGYLTFTLPVSRRTLYLSKTLNALIWTAASVCVILVVVLIGMLIIPSPSMIDDGELSSTVVGPFNLAAYSGIGQLFRAIWKWTGAWSLAYFVEGLALLVLLQLFSSGIIQLCITIGSILAKRHKLLAAIGIYYAVYSVLSIVSQFVFLFGFSMSGDGLFMILANLPKTALLGFIALALLLACVIVAAVDLILHFITLGKLERRLNLA